MTIRRRFASVPPVFVSAKTTRSRSYDALPVRAGLSLMGYPASRADKMAYGSRAEDFIGHRVTNASMFSNYALEEGYDTARQSRNRDARLLRDATDAIVSSESFATPQTSVAARRVARGQSMAPRAVSVPPRPLYPLEVDYWDVPGSYAPLYKPDTLDTTTTDDFYPYYFRRPLFVYPKPWLFQDRGRMMMQRPLMRAKSMPPPQLMFQEEQRRKVQALPVYDEWRGLARAKSVSPEMVLPGSHSWYLPYFERSLSPYYRRRLALSQPFREMPFLPLPTEGLRAHRMPRRYLARDFLRVGFPSLWGYYGYGPGSRRREEEEAEGIRYGFRPRVLASPLARASLARAWRHATMPSAPFKATMAYHQESKSSFPLLYAPPKGPKRGGRRKAAIIASKMDVDSFKGRRPRSEYAARKYRSMRLADQENIYAKSPRTAGYYASHPPLSAQASGSKTLSKVVVRRPGSWSEQVVTVPYQTAKKRSRFLGKASTTQPVKYFPSPYDFPDPRLNVPPKGTISPLPKQSAEDGAEGERQRAKVKIPSYYAYGVDPAHPPVSDLRRRIRKTLSKTRKH